MNSFTCHSESDLAMMAEKLLTAYPHNRIFAFDGQMGAGKTTFIKVVCEKLGVTQVTNSPTFAIVNEYLDSNDNSIYHFDFYRIENIDEAYQIGFEDYLDSDCYCFIEWPDKVTDILEQADVVNVSIDILPDDSRQFTF